MSGNENGKTPAPVIAAQEAVDAAKKRLDAADAKLVQLQRQVAEADADVAIAAQTIKKANRSVAELLPHSDQQLATAIAVSIRLVAKANGLRGLLDEAQAARALPAAEHEQACMQLGQLLQAEELRQAEEELATAKHYEAKAEMVLQNAQNERAKAWQRLHDLRARISNAQDRAWRQQLRQGQQPNGFERTVNSF